MPSTFFGIDIANTALAAAQMMMDVASQNIANDATPGYSRQVADLATTQPYALPDRAGAYTPMLGTGVQVQAVQRMRAGYLDGLYRMTQSDNGFQTTTGNLLSSVQSMLGEPGSNGLSTLMNQFFSDFQTLSEQPSSTAARTTVQQDGESVAARIQSIYKGLMQVGQQATTQAQTDAGTANTYLQELGQLNQSIAGAQALGQQPNDLLDQRDLLIDKISKLIPVTSATVTQQVGSQTISEVTLTTQTASGGSVTLLSGGAYGQLSVTPGSGSFSLSATDALSGATQSLAPTGGTIGAAYQFVNQDLNPSVSGPPPSLMYQLNQIVGSFTGAVNGQHEQGWYQDPTSGWTQATADPFFTAQGGGTISAQNIEVNPNIQSNVAYIAAGATGNSGDGQNATAIADIAGQTSGPLPQYAGFVAGIGTRIDLAQNLSATSQSLLQQVTSQREQVSGVSINQEMTNLVEAQSMYTAATKVAEAMDSALQSLIQSIQP